MTQYAHDTLAKMFTAAEGVPKMKDLVTSLQAQQRQVWLRADESTNAVYKLLRLDETGTDLFKSPQFSTWTSYVDAFNTKYPEEAVSIFAKLTKNYDDVTLSMMLEAAMKIPRTEVIATNLQAQLQTKRIQAWIASGKSTDYVFKLLKLDETGTNPFKSFQITTWVSYVDAFNKNFPDEAISAMSKVSKTLSKTYDDLTLSDMLEAAKSIPATKKVASELQRQQNQTWLANGKTVDDIFTLFKLNKPSLENLVNPRLGAWSSFVREYNMGVDPGKEASLIATMTSHYTDLGLAQLLQKGKTVDETKKIAEDLQIAQFNRWLYQEKTQDDVIELLGLKLDTWFSNPDRIIVLNYRRFYKAHEVIARPDVI
ncbi:hypothetical protein PHMEG_00024871 [Phytophthora megakarya]|uniref:RxLR effector PexRD54 WY domain-containing protein n=1 Tax=Phytophthora megakarya TaxID=4795 RepID=A0A225VDE9_9STRA|nr:hypothetical protein PHMEG_00024871 [Phytophthora megakarya]